MDDRTKQPFLANATALLFPIEWPEPFGLVMIEALACGTPVIAFRHGSVPEVIEHGVSGWIVEDEAAAIEAVRRVHELDRRRVREACHKVDFNGRGIQWMPRAPWTRRTRDFPSRPPQ